MNKKTALYSNCVLVNGFSRSVICDLQLQQIHYFPNSLYNLLNEHLGKTIEDIKSAYENKFDSTIEDYFRFLEEKECIFYTDYPERFPPLNLEWDYPHKISNAVIDYNDESGFDIISALNQLDDLKCKYIQLRFYSSVTKKKIIDILEYLKNKKSIISSVELYLKDSEWTFEGNIKDMFLKYPRLSECAVHSAKLKENISIGSKYLIYTTQNLASESHCGRISMQYFSINLKTYTEAKNYNSCLNKKIAVDKNGEIKNCPSMKESFGNIEDTLLKDAINNKEFRKKWGIKKDQIDVCKDCEYRYICTDCRAYTDENDYSKPLKCGYDPYTNTWEHWSDNSLKKSSIEFYGLTELT